MRAVFFFVAMTLLTLSFAPSLQSQGSPQRNDTSVPATDNVRLREMFDADAAMQQALNAEDTAIPPDWKKLRQEAIDRRKGLRESLKAGEVRTGTDFYRAAKIFDHGDTPDDFLAAHVLAMDALSRGSKDARWLSASTLDHYLHSVWEPQILGTWYARKVSRAPLTRVFMHEGVVGDGLRRLLCVAPVKGDDASPETLPKGETPDALALQQCDGGAPASNPRATELYKEDQADRGPKADLSKSAEHDAVRQAEARRMIDHGEVRTAEDLFHIAMVFQHSGTPDDILLAHALSLAAMAQGSSAAKWLSAATMDRYLRWVWRPQIFGTQFVGSLGAPLQQQPMAADLVTDSMRAAVCVVPLEQQRQIAADAAEGKPLRATSIANCK